MNDKDFVHLLLHQGFELVKDPSCTQFRPNIAALSGLFNFPCNFDGETCAGKSANKDKRCCCSNCRYSTGHFGKCWPNSLRTLSLYAEKFDKEDGFWRKNEGCILPRHRRSLTCAFYICPKIQEEFDKCNKEDIRELRLAVGQYTSRDYRYGSESGPYHKEILEVESKLNEMVEKFMWDRELYYDHSKEELVRVVKTETDKRGYITRHLETGGSVGYYTGVGPRTYKRQS